VVGRPGGVLHDTTMGGSLALTRLGLTRASSEFEFDSDSDVS
jgi:hypothetical protein